MAFLDKSGVEHLWTHIISKLGNKVDKIEGKGLSTNDYTTDEKNKLAGIANGATRVMVDSALSTTSTNPVQNKVVNSAISNLNTLVGDKSVLTQISDHNASTSTHSDIRNLITGLTTRLNTLLDSDDTTLDQLSEIVAYIKSNRSLIEGITTNKVNVADIINNLTTNVSNKPLSAAQGVALKSLIDNLQTVVDGKAASVHRHDVATTSAAGYMSADDKKKLDGIATGANKTTVDSELSTTSTNPVQNKVVNNAISVLKSLVGDKSVSTQIDAAVTPHTSDSTIHITDTERTKWNEKAEIINLIDDINSPKANFSPTEIIQAVSEGKVLYAIGGICTLMTRDNEFVRLHRQYNDPNVVAEITIYSDKSYSVDLITLAKSSDLSSHTENTTVHITSTERANWNAAKTHADSAHAPSNAEVNQNAFSNIVVGDTTIAADLKTDTLTLVGSNVILTPDATNDKITIGITKTNVTNALGYTPPTTNTTYDAAGTSLGLVKSGGDVSISSGVITVNDDSHNHVINNVDGLQSALDAKANRTDVTALSGLVGDKSVSEQIDSAISNIAISNIQIYSYGATAPTNTKLLWIDTSLGGVLKYYNGSAWTAIKSVWG